MKNLQVIWQVWIKRSFLLSTGDFNVAHRKIDPAHPDNSRRSAGFTDEERQGFTKLLAKGFTDTFRHIHGDIRNVYTWWAQTRSHANIIGN